MAFPEDPVLRYFAIADGFTALTLNTVDWDAQSPVEDWKACDVVWHLVDWIPDVLEDGASIALPRRDLRSNDPVGAWRQFDDALRAVLRRPETASAGFSHPQAGTMPLGTAIDMLIAPDVFMHSWDLAQATGQPFELDPDFAAGLLSGMQGIDAMLRASGQYGPRVHVADDVDIQTQLMAFVGRDPNWQSTHA